MKVLVKIVLRMKIKKKVLSSFFISNFLEEEEKKTFIATT